MASAIFSKSCPAPLTLASTPTSVTRASFCEPVIPEIINSLEETDWKYGLEGFMATQDMTDVAAYIDECIPEVYYVSSKPNCIDVMAKGVSKWNGIQLLADML